MENRIDQICVWFVYVVSAMLVLAIIAGIIYWTVTHIYDAAIMAGVIIFCLMLMRGLNVITTHKKNDNDVL